MPTLSRSRWLLLSFISIFATLRILKGMKQAFNKVKIQLSSHVNGLDIITSH
jgi:hypothetical protein